MKPAMLPLLFPLAGCGMLTTGIIGVHGGGPQIVGKGKPVEQTRRAEIASAIEASGALDVEIVSGSTPKLTVIAQKEILPHIKTSFKKGRLTISTEGSMQTDGTMRVRYTTPNVREVEANGATTVRASTISGGTVRIVLTGASKLKAAGKAQMLDITVSGASEADLKGVQAVDAKVDASGASKAWVKAKRKVDANATGASSILYIGKPTSVRQQTSGASSISAG